MDATSHRRRPQCRVHEMHHCGAKLQFWCISCTLLLALSGCASLRRHKIVPDSVATCRQLSREGVAAMERGQWDHARTLLEQAVEASPDDADAQRQLAETLWQSGAAQAAAVHMETAVTLDPNHAPTLVRSGEMLTVLGASDRALMRAEAAIALDGAQAGAWALRGRILRERGDLGRALADIQQALRYNPHGVDLLMDAAEMQYQLGRPQRCLSTLEHVLQAGAPGEEPQRALWLAGLAYGAVDRHDDAVASLYAASVRGAPQPELLCQLAQSQSAAGRHAEAVATARQALVADSGHVRSRALLARLEAGGVPGVDAPLRR